MDHVLHECGPDCDNEFCPYCRGGLAHCKVCGGAEASLPTECPGRMMDEAEEMAVQRGHIDFKGGKWHVEGAPGGKPTSYDEPGYAD